MRCGDLVYGVRHAGPVQLPSCGVAPRHYTLSVEPRTQRRPPYESTGNSWGCSFSVRKGCRRPAAPTLEHERQPASDNGNEYRLAKGLCLMAIGRRCTVLVGKSSGRRTCAARRSSMAHPCTDAPTAVLAARSPQLTAIYTISPQLSRAAVYHSDIRTPGTVPPLPGSAAAGPSPEGRPPSCDDRSETESSGRAIRNGPCRAKIYQAGQLRLATSVWRLRR
jgi:hypothetical protein